MPGSVRSPVSVSAVTTREVTRPTSGLRDDASRRAREVRRISQEACDVRSRPRTTDGESYLAAGHPLICSLCCADNRTVGNELHSPLPESIALTVGQPCRGDEVPRGSAVRRGV